MTDTFVSSLQSERGQSHLCNEQKVDDHQVGATFSRGWRRGGAEALRRAPRRQVAATGRGRRAQGAARHLRARDHRMEVQLEAVEGWRRPFWKQPGERPHWGKWFEELAALEGQVVPAALTRTLTETDNVLFTCLTMNPAPYSRCPFN